MTAECNDMAQLADLIYHAVLAGLQFKADVSTLTITYTGGY